jgi:outer membrane protein
MKNWLWLYLMLWSIVAEAQVQFDSFQDLLAYADGHAIAIQSAKIGEQISMAGKKETQSYLFPSINATAGYNDNITLQPTLVPAQLFNPGAPEGQFEELTFGRKYLYSTSVQAQWDVLNFQKIFATQTAAIQLKESQINTEINRFHTYNQLASTYYSIVLTQEALEIYEENIRVSNSILKSAREKFKRGIISEAELNFAEIKQLQDKSVFQTAQNNLSQFYTQLQSQLNTRETITVYNNPENFTLTDTDYMTTHIEVVWQKAEVEKYQSLLKQNRARQLPSLSLYYQYNYSWATDNFGDFSDVNQLPQQIFGFQVQIPIFKGLSTRHSIQQSEWELQMQVLKLENTRLAKHKEDELLQLQLEQASDQLSQNEQILALQKRNDAHAENQYQSEVMSLDERLSRYGDLLAAQDRYLQSLANFTLAQYKIYIRQIDFQPNDR